ncbi:IclR family transcriptional regulator [Streptomyces fuscichromogenes]|uniref:IclR family transcriptional regulator n=1 Tax=Streptomyces fuscichromogenes TaxID=1324013 RepID=UPI003570A379
MIEAARPHLAELCRRTSTVATLAVHDGGDSVCLLSLPGEAELQGVLMEAGRRLPLHATSSGLVLLAQASVSLQDEICDGPLHACTAATITDGAALRSCLAMVRRDGYAVVRGAFTEGRGGISAPVFGGDGAVVAPLGALRVTQLLSETRVAADAVTKRIRTETPRFTETGP